MNVFDLFAQISLDSRNYEAGLNAAESKTENFASKLKSGLATAAKASAVAIGAITTAAGALVTLFGRQITDVATLGDQIDKTSQKMGMTAQQYQEWDYIMKRSGADISSMTVSMKTLANAAQTDNKAFQKLGITQKQIAKLNQQELFALTIEQLQKVTDETERTYLAGQLLGRAATELGALLNMSAKETEELRQQVHKLGGVMSDEAVKASAKFQDALTDLQAAFQGAKNNTFINFLPSITTVFEGFSLILSGETEKGLDTLDKGIDEFVSKLSTAGPKVLDIAVRVINALATALMDNDEPILESVFDILQTVVNYISQNPDKITRFAFTIVKLFAKSLLGNLPIVAQAAIDIVSQLASTIGEEAPELIPVAVELILKLVDVLTAPENIIQLTEAGIKLVLGLVAGIIKAIPKIVECIPEITVNVISAMLDETPNLRIALFQIGGELIKGVINIGGSLIEGLFKGVKSGFEKFKNKFEDIGKAIKSFFTGEPIKDETTYSTYGGSFGTDYTSSGEYVKAETPTLPYETTSPTIGEQTFNIQVGEDKLATVIVDIMKKEARLA